MKKEFFESVMCRRLGQNKKKIISATIEQTYSKRNECQEYSLGVKAAGA
jgi:hypothetical protein